MRKRIDIDWTSLARRRQWDATPVSLREQERRFVWWWVRVGFQGFCVFVGAAGLLTWIAVEAVR